MKQLIYTTALLFICFTSCVNSNKMNKKERGITLDIDSLFMDCNHIAKFNSLGNRLHEPSNLIYCTYPSQRHCVWCGLCMSEADFMPQEYKEVRVPFFMTDSDTMYANGAFMYLDSMSKLNIDIWGCVFEELNKVDITCISRSINKKCSK